MALSRRNQALVSMAPAFALLVVATAAIMLLNERVPPMALALLALAGGIPSVIMISRGWNRVLWGDRIDRAVKRADAAPQDADARYEVGVLCAIRGEKDTAREAFEEARRIAPGHPPSTVGLGHLFADDENLSAALDMFQEAATTDPGLFAAHYGVASVHARREQYARAVQAYEKALELEPDDGYVLIGLARCHFELGDLGRANEYLDRAADHGVGDAELARAIRDASEIE